MMMKEDTSYRLEYRRGHYWPNLTRSYFCTSTHVLSW